VGGPGNKLPGLRSNKRNKRKRFYRIHPENDCAKLNLKNALWQPKYDAFNIFSEARLNGKLAYMHNHLVQAGLVNDAKDWKLGSAPS